MSHKARKESGNHKDKIGKINNDLWLVHVARTKNHKTLKLNIGEMCAYVDSSPGHNQNQN